MRVHFVEKFSEGDTDKQLAAMREAGFEFVDPNQAELLYCASITMMDKAFSIQRSTNKKIAVYCWDYYEWAHNKVNMSGNWIRYAELLRQADLIFVPSQGQKLRLKELLDLESTVVHTGIPIYDHAVRDDGFILDPLRYYPVPESQWAERAAKELGIPIIHSEHQYSEENFRELVATCSFMTCAVPEASTGGLTLMEGLHLGKSSLVSNSVYQGAWDYLDTFGFAFDANDYENFKFYMKSMWGSRPVFTKGREHVAKYSYANMAKGLYEGMYSLL